MGICSSSRGAADPGSALAICSQRIWTNHTGLKSGDTWLGSVKHALSPDASQDEKCNIINSQALIFEELNVTFLQEGLKQTNLWFQKLSQLLDLLQCLQHQHLWSNRSSNLCTTSSNQLFVEQLVYHGETEGASTSRPQRHRGVIFWKSPRCRRVQDVSFQPGVRGKAQIIV